MKIRFVLILQTVLLVAGCTGGEQPSSTNSTDSAVKEQPKGASAEQDGGAASENIEKPPADEPKDVALDRTDAAATAAAVLKAYQQKHLAELSTLCTAGNKETFSELAEQKEEHPRYQSIFSGWRWKSVTDWDGHVGDVRYRNDKTAVVKFGKISSTEIAVVMLKWDDQKWCFDDIKSPSGESFESLKATQKGE